MTKSVADHPSSRATVIYMRDTYVPPVRVAVDFKERLARYAATHDRDVSVGHQEGHRGYLDRHEAGVKSQTRGSELKPQPWPPRTRWYAPNADQGTPGPHTGPTWREGGVNVQDPNRAVPGHIYPEGHGFTGAISLGFDGKGNAAADQAEGPNQGHRQGQADQGRARPGSQASRPSRHRYTVGRPSRTGCPRASRAATRAPHRPPHPGRAARHAADRGEPGSRS